MPFYRRDLDEDQGPEGAHVTPLAASQRAAADFSVSANAEAAMRHQRYAALADIARAFNATAIVTAHQADDQLETLLMRLIRGSSVRGLGGIRWRRRLAEGGMAEPMTGDPGAPPDSQLMLLRPMLAVTRDEAGWFLHALGESWCEDPTNADLTGRRARLRSDVLPVLRELQPDAARKAVKLTGHFRGLHRLLRTEVGRRREGVVVDRDEAGRVILGRADAATLHGVVLSELLRDLLAEGGAPSDRLTGNTLRPLIAAIRDQQGGCRRFDMPGGVTAWLTRRELQLAPAESV